MTYVLGWSVIPQILVSRERWSGRAGLRCTPLVYPGQEVQPDQPIIRVEQRDAVVQNVAAPSAAVSATGRSAGPPETEISGVNGHTPAASSEMLPAGLRGRVVDITRRGGVIIESQAAVVQGVIGAGKQVAGVLTMWQPSSGGRRQVIPPGALLVIPGPVNFSMLRQAMSSGVAGVIASSISSRDLEGFLQADLIRLLQSTTADIQAANLPDLTLLFTEGLGTSAMPVQTINLLSQYQGAIALMAGTTSIQEQIFPELIISLPEREVEQQGRPIQPEPDLVQGARVRVCSGEYEGIIGDIDYLFTHQQTFASGIRARAARVRREDGAILVVPLSILERIS